MVDFFYFKSTIKLTFFVIFCHFWTKKYLYIKNKNIMGKITKTFSIEEKLYDKFELMCKSKGINKSKIIQDAIKTFIGQNYEINKKLSYKLKYDENSEAIHIIDKDLDFFILDNGNKINIFDFEILYEEFDDCVSNVLNNLKNETKNETETETENENENENEVDPNILNTTVFNLNDLKKAVLNVDENENIIVNNSDELLVRLIEKRKELKNTYILTDPKDLNKLKEIFAYIIDDNFDLKYKNTLEIYMPLKYQTNIDLISAFRSLTNIYTMFDIESISKMEKLKVDIKNCILAHRFNNPAPNDNVKLRFDDPFYIFVLPSSEFICDDIRNYIKTFGIKDEYILLKN